MADSTLKHTFTYRAFGLLLQSEIELPELIIADGPADIRITLGKVPEHLAAPSKRGVLFEVAENEVLINVNRVGRFLISMGNQVQIDPAAGADERDVRTFLLGSVMGALAHQRGLLPIHGSAIRLAEGCAIFTGPSGVGKSTLVAALAQQGHAVLTDDISVVQPSTQQCLLYPGIPRLKLWGDTLEKLQHSPQSFSTLLNRIEKFHFPVHAQFCHDPLPVRKIVLLRSHHDSDFRITSTSGIERFNGIKDSVYRLNFVAGMLADQKLFGLTSQLAKQVDVHVISRPMRPFMLAELTEFVMHALAN
ncbi:MAG: hypothetical protein ACT4NL_17405 [Pseudomarimonas sp.]